MNENKKTYHIKNAMELIVEDIFEDLMRHNDFNMCTCDKCMSDVIAITLNNLKPRYVVSRKGEIYSKVDEMREQIRVDVMENLIKAIEIVKNNPHHHDED